MLGLPSRSAFGMARIGRHGDVRGIHAEVALGAEHGHRRVVHRDGEQREDAGVLAARGLASLGDLNRRLDIVVGDVAVEEERDVRLVQSPRGAGLHAHRRHLVEARGVGRAVEGRPWPRKGRLELGVAGQHERRGEGDVARRHGGTGRGLPLADHCAGAVERGHRVAEAVGRTPRQDLVRDVLAPVDAALDFRRVVAIELGERQRALLVEPGQLRRIKRLQADIGRLHHRRAAMGSGRRGLGHEDGRVCPADAVSGVEHRGVHGRRHTHGLRIAERARDDRIEHHLVPHQGLIDDSARLA